MKKKILSTIWVMGVLTLAVFCLSACDRELDVQQSYPFTVETMPVQKDIIRGQTAEIRCTLKRGGEFADTRYTIRSPKMCSAYTTPRCHLTVRRLTCTWRIIWAVCSD